MSAINEEEEFEFLNRMEQEAQAGIPPPHPDPSTLDVAANATAKGAAGFVDMFLNAPVNAWNVAKAGAVAMGDITGFPQARENLEITPQPNLAEKALRSVGAISEAREPQTAMQRILDTAVQTGVNVAASPASGAMGVARNLGMGLASGAAAQATKEATGSDLAATAVGMAVPLLGSAVASRANAPTLKNPVKLTTLQEARQAGLTVVPSQVKPSVTTNKLEGLGGKAAIKQQVQAANVEKIDLLAKRGLGIPDEVPITKESIQQVRDVAAKPYEQVEQLRASATNLPWFPRYHSASLLEELKQARTDAQLKFTEYNRTGSVDTLNLAKKFRAEAASLEKDIEMVAKASGQPELVKQLKAGRELYARTYDVERATNFADGHVDPNVFAALFRKGKPLSGELRVIGKFAAAYPDAVRPAARIQSAGVSGTEAGMSALLGIGGAAAAGPMGLLAGGLPLLRSPARAMLLSKGYQNRLLKEPPALNEAMLKSALAGRSVAESER